MFFDDPELGRARFHDEVIRLSSEVSKEFWFSIRYKKSLIDSAYASAQQTIFFHGIEVGSTNHFKQLAHLAYWLCRFKPLRIEPPQNIRGMIQSLAKAGMEKLYGEDAFPENEYNNAVQNFQSNMLFPINEYCGIMLCYDFIKLAWDRQLKDEADEGKRRLLQDRVDFLDARFSEKVAEELVWSLSYHNFSARGFAVTLESILDVRTEKE